ncbi:HIT family protein [Rapidithrix thailandica]|uniref:HIT family protein n=1 Tax=Rapidithrix thailandica TaxID=413964 RepID=A0AAW9RZJ7_9BACT
MASIFTKIVQGEIPCHKIAENDNYFAFLDINPLTEGHTLVIPKKEVDYMFDLDDELLAGLHVFAKKVARALQKAVPCVRVGSCVMGLEVPHAHLHLIPFQMMSDMSFTNPKLNLTQDQLAEIAAKVRNHLDQ